VVLNYILVSCFFWQYVGMRIIYSVESTEGNFYTQSITCRGACRGVPSLQGSESLAWKPISFRCILETFPHRKNRNPRKSTIYNGEAVARSTGCVYASGEQRRAGKCGVCVDGCW